MLAIAAAVIISFTLQPWALRFANSKGLVDVPNHRSSHNVATPRTGGLGVLAGAVGASILSQLRSTDEWPTVTAVCLSILAFAALGFCDDLAGLSAHSRLLVQFMLAALSSAVLLLLLDPPDLPAFIPLAVGATLLTVACVNAFNFMDGVNGLASINASISAVLLSCLLAFEDQHELAAIAAATAAAALGFLPWNFPRARLFLGDVGSYGLGSALGILTVSACICGADPVICLLSLFIYGVDTSATVVARARRGSSLLGAHREHVYQRLAAQGWGHTGATFVSATASVLVCSWGLLVESQDWSSLVALPVPALVGACYLGLPRLTPARGPGGL